MNRSAAFTLVELLVVAAVIGILAALLMPVVLRAMNAAITAKCGGNLKQVHAGLIAYAREYPVSIVTTRNPPHDRVSTWTYWYNTLDRYVGDARAGACPAKSQCTHGYGQNYRVLGGMDSLLSLWISY